MKYTDMIFTPCVALVVTCPVCRETVYVVNSPVVYARIIEVIEKHKCVVRSRDGKQVEVSERKV